MTSTWDIRLYLYTNSSGKFIKVFSQIPNKINEKYKLSSILFKMKPFTWETYVSLNKKCSKDGNLNDIDYMLLKEKKILEGICDWDLSDKDGKKMEVNKENIFNLHPSIVEMLSDEYDKMSYVTNKEKKEIVININKYYMSAMIGTGNVSTPLEIVEMTLMEKFGWTPMEIAQIPYKKIQEIFMVLNQREISSESAIEFKKGGK